MRNPGRLVVAHLLLVLGLSVYLFLVIISYDDGYGSHFDGNIGAGLVALPLLALGLPWSLAISDVGGSVAARMLFVVTPALLNVGIHAWVAGRRSMARSASTRGR